MVNAFGTIFGISGALMIASDIKMELLGYTLFILSNVIWGLFAYKTSNKELFIMNLVYLIISFIGFYNFI